MPYHANFCLDPKRFVIGIEDGSIAFGSTQVALPPAQPRMIPVVLVELAPDSLAMVKRIAPELKRLNLSPRLHIWDEGGDFVHCGIDLRIEPPDKEFLRTLIRAEQYDLLDAHAWEALVCVTACLVRARDAERMKQEIAGTRAFAMYIKRSGSASRIMAIDPKRDDVLTFVGREIHHAKPRMYD